MAVIDELTGYPINFVDARGYVRLECDGHPLAGKDGRFPRHRAVLFEHLDYPRATPCHWCGYCLPWKSWMTPSYQRVVCVDHLNGVPGDDRLENLVPACWWCNANRGWAQTFHPDWFERFCRWLADVPPWERPNLPAIVSEIVGHDVMEIWKQYRSEEPW